MSAALSERVERVVGYPPLCELAADHRRESQEALLEADTFEDLPGKWQAAIMEAEQNRPKLRSGRTKRPGCSTPTWTRLGGTVRSRLARTSRPHPPGFRMGKPETAPGSA